MYKKYTQLILAYSFLYGSFLFSMDNQQQECQNDEELDPLYVALVEIELQPVPGAQRHIIQVAPHFYNNC